MKKLYNMKLTVITNVVCSFGMVWIGMKKILVEVKIKGKKQDHLDHGIGKII